MIERLNNVVFSYGSSLLSGERIGKFALIGALGLMIDNGVLALLFEFGPVPLDVAALCSKETSILMMFVCNECWTFSDQQRGGRRAQLVRLVKSNAVRAVGGIVGILVLLFLNSSFGVWYVIANISGIAVGFGFNYVLESLFTWKVNRN